MKEFLIALGLFTLIHGVATTAFYHRWGTHRSFKCKKWVSYLGVTIAYLAFSGSPLGWWANHRIHHQTVDTPLDPHSPKWRGFTYAWGGWLFNRFLTKDQIARQVPDHIDDPYFRLLGDDTFPAKPWLAFWVCILFRVLLWVLFGWKIALASLLAGILALTNSFWVNTICHLPYFGYRRFRSNDESRNVLWLIVPTAGESLHNNHHWRPKRCSASHAWYELDPTYWFIVGLSKVGLVWDIVK